MTYSFIYTKYCNCCKPVLFFVSVRSLFILIYMYGKISSFANRRLRLAFDSMSGSKKTQRGWIFNYWMLSKNNSIVEHSAVFGKATSISSYRNTSYHRNVCKWLILDRNTWYLITVCKLSLLEGYARNH